MIETFFVTSYFPSIKGFILTFLLWESVSATVLFLIIWPLLYMFKSRNPYWKLGLLTLVLLRFILPYNISGPFTLYSIYNQFIAQNEMSQIETAGPQSILDEGFLDFDTSLIHTGQDLSIYREHLQTVLLSIWFCGFIGMLLFQIKSKLRFYRYARNCDPASPDVVNVHLYYWKKGLKIGRKVRIKAGSEFNTPFTIGIMRPVIYIPISMLDDPDIDNRVIIGHEMVHIRSFHDLKLNVQLLIQSLFFFHPLIYLINRMIYELRDQVCDLTIINDRSVKRVKYARSLLRILETPRYSSKMNALTNGFALNNKTSKARINIIMKGISMKKKIPVLSVILLALIVLPLSSFALGNNKPVQSTSSAKAKKIESSSVKMRLPIEQGRVSSRFGKRFHPIHKKEKHHNGIDIAAPKGTPIYSSAEGVVSFSGKKGGYGNVIIIDHAGDFQTVYAQLSEVLVEKGTSLRAGFMIGRCGDSGISTAPHLHYEIRHKGEFVNPERYVDFAGLNR